MFSHLRRFVKVYSLPIFVILLAFTIYYFIFEIVRNKNSNLSPISEEELILAQDENSQNHLDNDSSTTQELQASQDLQDQNQINAAQIDPKDNQAQNTIQQKTQDVNQKEAQEEVQKEVQEIIQTLPEYTTNKEIVSSSVASLNIRKEPSLQAEIIGRLTPKLKAVILEDNGDWILLGNLFNDAPLGWVLKSYTLKVTPPLEESIDTNIQPSFTSRVEALNIRSDPSLEGSILSRLTPADRVYIIEDGANGWVKIQDINTPPKKEGWVVKRSLVQAN